MRLPEPAFDRTERAADSGLASLSGWHILKPGRNCWRVSEAGKGAVLIDGSPYFAHLEDALRQAEQSILIVGWDFDGSIRLRPDLPPETSPPLGQLLRSLVETRPQLEIHILVWSVAVVHAPGDPLPLLFGAEWQDHPRIRLKLDTRHPIYAAHHQKIVCVDGSLAFVGGIDLTLRRWDRHPHMVDDPARTQPDGTPYGPVHDVQMVVQGEAAKAVCALASNRWKNATGEELPKPSPQDIWPRGLQEDFIATTVAIARTAPACNNEPPITEGATLAVDALKAARHIIYIEAQYMTAAYIGDVLAESLRQETGPEIVAVMTHSSRGLIERFLMGRNRDRLIRRLKRADRYGRLLVCYPVVPKADGRPQQVLVHSKLIIVDDTFLRVGSSNLNNRSFGLDTEADLAIEAATDVERATIVRLRNELVAEHLGSRAEAVAEIVARTGSLLEAIKSLNRDPCRLCPFEAMSGAGPTRPVFGTRLLDPKRPFEPLWFLRRKRRGVSLGRNAL
jgi:phosphatidylserine/phosphatidylglycerophosphate/cardiolipin synthase-like enzyme